MNTGKRLDEAYRKALVVPFGDKDRFIIFSDAHRGDNSAADEFAHNQSIFYHALNYYNAHAYTFIEAGDGDELWEHKRFRHIREAHSDVYQLLSSFHAEKRLLLLYGNHNMYWRNSASVVRDLYRFHDEYTDSDTDLLPGIRVHEALRLRHAASGKELFILHGHQGDLTNDQLWRMSMILFRYFWRFMHIVGFRNPASPAKNVDKQHKIEKNFIRWIARTGIPVLCGHTHRPKFPASGGMPYLNSGCCVHPRGITGIEVSDGEISLVDWRIRPDEKGVLSVSRKIIRGPLPLASLGYPHQDHEPDLNMRKIGQKRRNAVHGRADGQHL